MKCLKTLLLGAWIASHSLLYGQDSTFNDTSFVVSDSTYFLYQSNLVLSKYKSRLPRISQKLDAQARGTNGTPSFLYNSTGNSGAYSGAGYTGLSDFFSENRKYIGGDLRVNTFTGMAALSIPVYTLQSRKLSVPISVNYSSDGVRVRDVAGHVGMGWNLSYGGSITRVVKGLPDERLGAGFIHQIANINGFDFLSKDQKEDFIEKSTNGEIDTQPDEFYYNINGSGGKFVLNAAGVGITIPHQDHYIKAEFSLGQLYKIYITDENGITYTFGGWDAVEITEIRNTTFPYTSDLTYETWGDENLFDDYEDLIDQYNQLINDYNNLLEVALDLESEHIRKLQQPCKSYDCDCECDISFNDLGGAPCPEYAVTCEGGYPISDDYSTNVALLEGYEDDLEGWVEDLHELDSLAEIAYGLYLKSFSNVSGDLYDMPAALSSYTSPKLRKNEIEEKSVQSYISKWNIASIEDHNKEDRISFFYDAEIVYRLDPSSTQLEQCVTEASYYNNEFTGLFYQDHSNSIAGAAPNPNVVRDDNEEFDPIFSENALPFGIVRAENVTTIINLQKRVASIRTKSGMRADFLYTKGRKDAGISSVYKLSSIEVKNGARDLIRKLNFNYENVESVYHTSKPDPFSKLEADLLSEYDFFDFTGSTIDASMPIIQSEIQNLPFRRKRIMEDLLRPANYYRLFLKSITQVGSGECVDDVSLRPFKFEYNHPEKLPRMTSPLVDMFGYPIMYVEQFQSTTYCQNQNIPNCTPDQLHVYPDVRTDLMGRSDYGILNSVQYPTGGIQKIVYGKNVATNSQYKVGMRVEKIIDYDVDNTQLGVKHYQYSNGVFLSSPPKNITYENVYFKRGVGKLKISSSYNQEVEKMLESGVVGYGTCTVYQGNDLHTPVNHNGYTVFTYKVPITQHNSIGFITSYRPIVRSTDSDEFENSVYPFSEYIGFDHQHGNLLISQVFDNNDQLVKETINQFEYNNFTPEVRVKGIKTGVSQITENHFRYSPYIYGSNWAKLVSTTSKTYYNYPNPSVITDVTQYQTNSYDHQVRRAERSDSKNNVEVIETRYPADYLPLQFNAGSNALVLNGATSVEQNSVPAVMFERHIHRIPLEITTSFNGEVQEATANVYEVDNSGNIMLKNIQNAVGVLTNFNLSHLNSVGEFTLDAHYVKEIENLHFDDLGNADLVQARGKEKVSLVYHHRGDGIVATVIGAAPQEIGYTSFEDPDGEEGNLIYDATNFDPDDKKTGDRSYSGDVIFADMPNGDYIISYWLMGTVDEVTCRNNMGTFEFDKVNYATTDNGWIYKEHIFHHYDPHVDPPEPPQDGGDPGLSRPSGGGSSSSPSGTGNFHSGTDDLRIRANHIDELRIYPVGARVTSKALKQGVGVTEQIDYNGGVVHFEFDQHQRIQNIRNADKNILQHFAYGNTNLNKVVFEGFEGGSATLITEVCGNTFYYEKGVQIGKWTFETDQCTTVDHVIINEVIQTLPYFDGLTGTQWDLTSIPTEVGNEYAVRALNLVDNETTLKIVLTPIIPCSHD